MRRWLARAVQWALALIGRRFPNLFLEATVTAYLERHPGSTKREAIRWACDLARELEIEPWA